MLSGTLPDEKKNAFERYKTLLNETDPFAVIDDAQVKFKSEDAQLGKGIARKKSPNLFSPAQMVVPNVNLETVQSVLRDRLNRLRIQGIHLQHKGGYTFEFSGQITQENLFNLQKEMNQLTLDWKPNGQAIVIQYATPISVAYLAPYGFSYAQPPRTFSVKVSLFLTNTSQNSILIDIPVTNYNYQDFMNTIKEKTAQSFDSRLANVKNSNEHYWVFGLDNQPVDASNFTAAIQHLLNNPGKILAVCINLQYNHTSACIPTPGL